MTLFKELEGAASGTRVPLAKVLDALPFNEQGLIPVIAQDHMTKTVLMLAWMDRHAVERTLDKGLVCYFSRSRQTYWQKGETSGNVQELVEMTFDCDADAILISVAQTGPACHTNRPSCFYLRVEKDEVSVKS